MITARILFGLIVAISVLSGCLIQPSNPADINQYNNQIISLVSPFITPVVGILTVLALWVKANIDKKDIKDTAKEAAKAAAEEAKNTAVTLVQKTDIIKDEVLTKLDASHAASAEAISKANNTNEKILELQKQQATRHLSRSTDIPTAKA